MITEKNPHLHARNAIQLSLAIFWFCGSVVAAAFSFFDSNEFEMLFSFRKERFNSNTWNTLVYIYCAIMIIDCLLSLGCITFFGCALDRRMGTQQLRRGLKIILGALVSIFVLGIPFGACILYRRSVWNEDVKSSNENAWVLGVDAFFYSFIHFLLLCQIPTTIGTLRALNYTQSDEQVSEKAVLQNATL